MLSPPLLALATLAAAASAAPNSTISPGCQQACASLSASFPSAVFYPATDNLTIWDAKQQEVIPSQACRVAPSSSEDTSRILQQLVQSQCHFAVKCGGHSREAGDSIAVAGVTIDLHPHLSGVEVATDGLSARVGGGATLIDAYRALDARGLSFVGGRVASVGAGGYMLGGGTSPFANKFGWALDNVYEFEVVLANATVTTASEDKNPDLYFALRGGGNNFGIVTTFTVRTFEQGSVYRGSASYSDNQTETVLDAVYDLFTKPESSSDENMGYDMYYAWANGQFSMGGQQWYHEPIANPPVFNRLNAIPTARITPSVNTTTNLVSGGPPSSALVRHVFGTFSILPSRSVMSEAVAIFKEEVNAISSVVGLAPNLICYSMPVNAIKAMKRRGGNALGIESDEPLFVWLVSTAWTNAQDDAAVYKMTDNVARRTEAAAQKVGRYHPYKYINYASAAEAPTIFEGYGETNRQRLIKIQKAVDPSGVFASTGLWRGFMKLV